MRRRGAIHGRGRRRLEDNGDCRVTLTHDETEIKFTLDGFDAVSEKR
jgi:hypothetical protein